MSKTDSLRGKIADAENARDAAEQRANDASEKIERLEAVLEELNNNVPGIKAIIDDLNTTNKSIDKNWKGNSYSDYRDKSESELINVGLSLYYERITYDIVGTIKHEIHLQECEKNEAESDYNTYNNKVNNYTNDLRKEKRKR